MHHYEAQKKRALTMHAIGATTPPYPCKVAHAMPTCLTGY